MPEGYPEACPPDITFDIKKGISEKQKPEIEELITAQLEENSGCASMYIVAEAVREWLVDNNVQGQVSYTAIAVLSENMLHFMKLNVTEILNGHYLFPLHVTCRL